MKRTILQNRVLYVGFIVCLPILLNGCFWPFTAMDGELVRTRKTVSSAASTETEETLPEGMDAETKEEELQSLPVEPDEELPAPAPLELTAPVPEEPEAPIPEEALPPAPEEPIALAQKTPAAPAPEEPIAPAAEEVEPAAPEEAVSPTPEVPVTPAPEEAPVVEEKKASIEDAPRLAEKYPGLATGILSQAVLQDLGSGDLLSSGDISITENSFNEALSKMPEEERKADDPLTFDVFEHMATKILLARRVKEETGVTPEDPAWEGAMQAYYDKVAGPAKTTEEEAAAFYLENKDLFADTPFDTVREELRAYLGEERQKAAFEKHLRNYGKEVPVKVHGPWVAQQAGRFKNNVIDKALDEGKPLLVDFYAHWCGPCMHMKPTLEKLGNQYADVLNILFIDVDKHTVLAKRHRADSIPLLLLYDAKGDLVTRLEGYQEETELMRELQKVGVQ